MQTRRAEAHLRLQVVLPTSTVTSSTPLTFPPSTPQFARRTSTIFSTSSTDSILDDPKRCEVRRIKELDPLEVQLIAWAIVTQMRDVHLGLLNHPAFVKDKPIQLEAFARFEDRFVATMDACRRSKTMVHGILPAPFITRLVAAPIAELQFKQDNKANNDRKKEQKQQREESSTMPFSDFSQAIEAEKSVPRQRVEKLSAFEAEVLSIKLVRAAMAAHRGFLGIPAFFEGEKSGKPKFEKYPIFHDRISRRPLRYIHRPLAPFSTKGRNLAGNLEKADQLKSAKDVKNKAKEDGTMATGTTGVDEQPPTSTPSTAIQEPFVLQPLTEEDPELQQVMGQP
ncbi:hypothetical protein QBC34DRAFT_428551 [Podospora aff. communis PSN243]|uniref:Uncharacterized protein n=1 Tax=Podospora aff. communis PSN243 TaxID=3040156 RepID=A0AAV9GC41_9PEZI|nr:hypothetical protein QBC34DRAFT_428551 [Podospora aff. communis PSN243]